MMRRYQSNSTRFAQPDPYDGSYNLSDPQSFNRYAYVQNDPVNFVDPSGLDGETFRINCVGANCSIVEGTLIVNSTSTPRRGSGGGSLLGDVMIATDVVGGDPAVPGGTLLMGPVRGSNGLGDVNTGFTVCGIAASGGEYSNFVNGRWVGLTQNGLRTYSMSWPGNQYVARSSALNNASAFRALGKVSFVATTGIGLYQGYGHYQEGNYSASAKSGLDIGMGALGTFGGPQGAVIAGGYFAVDLTIGWDRVAAMEANDQFTQRLVNGQGICFYPSMVK